MLLSYFKGDRFFSSKSVIERFFYHILLSLIYISRYYSLYVYRVAETLDFYQLSHCVALYKLLTTFVGNNKRKMQKRFYLGNPHDDIGLIVARL